MCFLLKAIRIVMQQVQKQWGIPPFALVQLLSHFLLRYLLADWRHWRKCLLHLSALLYTSDDIIVPGFTHISMLKVTIWHQFLFIMSLVFIRRDSLLMFMTFRLLTSCFCTARCSGTHQKRVFADHLVLGPTWLVSWHVTDCALWGGGCILIEDVYLLLKYTLKQKIRPKGSRHQQNQMHGSGDSFCMQCHKSLLTWP